MINLPVISWNCLKAKPLNTILNVLILSLGLATIIVLILLSHQFEEKLEKNTQGIDLVVGAKGSPLQLILCNIFHVDFPTGNIPLGEADQLVRHPLIKSAVPLALGDSYRGYRIVGTTPAYPAIYEAEVAEGSMWEADFEATIGAFAAKQLELGLGDTFYGAHGMGSATSHSHEEQAFKVVGILAETNTVMDNLILTNVQSVWYSHDTHGEENSTDSVSHEAHEEEVAEVGIDPETGLPRGKEGREITSLLVDYRSPLAAIQLPRLINTQTDMQAASPAFEVARLFSIVGVGADVVQAFAYMMVLIAVLSIFIALYNALKERKYDLAVMRSLGSSRTQLFVMVVLEGVIVTLLSVFLGLIMGHGVIELLAGWIEQTEQVGLTGKLFLPLEWLVIGGALVVGVLTALIPAWQAYRTDISKVLARG